MNYTTSTSFDPEKEFTGFTQGEWKANCYRGSTYVDSPDCLIYSITDADQIYHPDTINRWHADARLCAAAPRLLKQRNALYKVLIDVINTELPASAQDFENQKKAWTEAFKVLRSIENSIEPNNGAKDDDKGDKKDPDFGREMRTCNGKKCWFYRREGENIGVVFAQHELIVPLPSIHFLYEPVEFADNPSNPGTRVNNEIKPKRQIIKLWASGGPSNNIDDYLMDDGSICTIRRSTCEILNEVYPPGTIQVPTVQYVRNN